MSVEGKKRINGAWANAISMGIVNSQANKKKRVTDLIFAFSLINKDPYTQNAKHGFILLP
jgi:hypothetical protein